MFLDCSLARCQTLMREMIRCSVAPPPVEHFDPDRVPLMIVAIVETDEKVSSAYLRMGQLGWVKFKLAA